MWISVNLWFISTLSGLNEKDNPGLRALQPGYSSYFEAYRTWTTLLMTESPFQSNYPRNCTSYLLDSELDQDSGILLELSSKMISGNKIPCKALWIAYIAGRLM